MKGIKGIKGHLNEVSKPGRIVKRAIAGTSKSCSGCSSCMARNGFL